MGNIAKPTGIKECNLGIVERFARLFEIQDSGCWQWKGSIRKTGYGVYAINRVPKRVHRIMWELIGNSFNPTKQLDHLCRNKGCLNPKHLEEVTPRTNTMRGKTITANNYKKTHCIHGHELIGKNLYLKKRPTHTYFERVCRECRRIYQRKDFKGFENA